MNNLKRDKFKLVSNDWYHKKIPSIVLKHRTTKTDPTYKFVINSDIYIRSSVPVKVDSTNNTYYYDLLNILAPSPNIVTGSQWLDFLNTKYNVSLNIGDNYPSANFPELIFENIEDRDLLDQIYETLIDSMRPDGLAVLFDFTLQVSGGFIRNKLDIDTNALKPWLINDLSFNLLALIMSKDSINSGFKVKNSYKDSLKLTDVEVFYLESLFKFNSDILPKNDNDTLYLWDLLNRSSGASLASKQFLFGFVFEGINLTNVINKDFSMGVDSNNRPFNVKVYSASKFDNITQRVFIPEPLQPEEGV